MPTIMADHDVEGHLEVLLRIWLSPDWRESWADVSCNIESFERLGIGEDASDMEIWLSCQRRAIVLITGNRNAQGDDSLERTIRRNLEPHHLPVFTISDPNRLMRDGDYAEDVAVSLIEHLERLDSLRGAGRLYLP
jgi:hypothetical protein